MSDAIEICGLAKRFDGLAALDDVTLTVPQGSVYGFLGPNGAGKTTMLRILTGLARPSAGDARIFGCAPGSADARRVTGYLPDVPGFYPWMDAEEFLRFSAGLFGLDRNLVEERVPLLLDMAGLAGISARIGGFSRGMRQRLGVAQALVNAPSLLLLDEPTSALDPLGRKAVLDMIESLAGRTTVFFSTHILADVERVCDRVAILDRGRLVAESRVDELKQRYSAHRVIIEVDGNAAGLAADLEATEWASSIEREGDRSLIVTVTDPEAARREVPALIVQRGLGLERFESGEVSLEDVFVELVGERR